MSWNHYEYFTSLFGKKVQVLLLLPSYPYFPQQFVFTVIFSSALFFLLFLGRSDNRLYLGGYTVSATTFLGADQSALSGIDTVGISYVLSMHQPCSNQSNMDAYL